MSTLPFDAELVAAAARAHAEPIPMEGDEPPDNVVPLNAPAPPEGIIPLGHDQGVFYYLSRASGQVHRLSADNHTKKTLLAMASLPHYWQRSRFVSEKGQIFWDDATDWLMTACRAVGIYDPDRIRGRGAWLDDGRAVLHLGDRLIVDGGDHPLTLPGSRAIYPAALRLPVPLAPPLRNAEAHRLCALTNTLRWEKPISGTLFAGWIVCAMVCGALRWRPAVWVTGGFGSGKSWLIDNILSPVIGPVALHVLSKTSEAGIRHRLQSDALPVIFDEFEREDSAAAVRVQGVLDLMRQASSESAGRILKGDPNQAAARGYRIRSCFCFSSINVGLAHSADESRVTVLSLRGPDVSPESQARFAALTAQAAALATPAYAGGLLARCVANLPALRANAETFAIAVAARMGTRRLGDQLGALLAGAYLLHSDQLITSQRAADWIGQQDWGESTSATPTPEPERLISHLTAHRLRVSLGNGSPIETTVSALIAAAFGSHDRIAPDQACQELREIGIRPKTDRPLGVWISTSHSAIAKALSGTPWAAGWGRTIGRVPGADVTTQRFTLGHRSRAVWVPLAVLDAE